MSFSHLQNRRLLTFLCLLRASRVVHIRYFKYAYTHTHRKRYAICYLAKTIRFYGSSWPECMRRPHLSAIYIDTTIIFLLILDSTGNDRSIPIQMKTTKSLEIPHQFEGYARVFFGIRQPRRFDSIYRGPEPPIKYITISGSPSTHKKKTKKKM